MAPQSTLDAVVGVVGGGQLGRMMAEAAAPLGVELVVLDPTPDAPAAPVARDQIVASFDDEAGMRALAERCDLVTFEIELADPNALERAAEATGTPVEPAPGTLRMIQDKLRQKRRLRSAEIPVPRLRAVDDVEDLETAGEEFGYPMMLKARSGGYDGRGNVPVSGPVAATDALDAIEGPAMVEEFAEFVREISVIAVNGAEERRCYVPAENIHEEEILRESVVPARTDDKVLDRAVSVAHDVLDILEGRGVYGIELFEMADGRILVNEIAPRPHNSGHWTIEGAVTSQFEQHVRAVLGAPLGGTALRSPVVTANVLGDVNAPCPADPDGIGQVLAGDDAHLHWYGKDQVRPLRKMGHVTVHDPNQHDRDRLLEAARTYTDGVTFRADGG